MTDVDSQSAALAAMGLRFEQAPEKPSVGVWPEHWRVLEVFYACPARWVAKSPQDSGLQHSMLPWVLDRAGVPPGEQLQVLADVRSIESAALTALV